jgi:Ca2+-binding EF-hand superfamily protein
MASKLASKMLGELDANQDGSIDKKEFVTGMTTKGVSVADAGKMFDAIDTKKAGAINKSDIETAVKSGALKPPPGGAPSGAGGKPPPGGGGGGGGGSSQSYDAADTNKDGTVSAQEALLYSMKHPSNTKSQMAALSSLGKNVDKTV